MSETGSSSHGEYHDLPVERDGSPDPPAMPEPGAVDLRRLHAEAVACCHAAVAHAEAAELSHLEEMGRRLGEEQDDMYRLVMAAVPGAVKEAAARGQRVATLLRFDGADKLREFCYLYMLKGPHKQELRQEMRAMGVRPLLHRLRVEFQRAGFGVHHAWQRATNENTLSVTW